MQSMGVKVLIATGVKAEHARQIALDTRILRQEHQKICGAVIEGPNICKIAMGYTETEQEFSFAPEYLAVLSRASMDERALLVDYLMKKNPSARCGN